MKIRNKSHSRRRRLIALDATPLEARRLLALTASWIGQVPGQLHDRVGPSRSVPSSNFNDIADACIQLNGLSPTDTLDYVEIRQDGGGGSFDSLASSSNWKVDIIRDAGATSAQLYFEPAAAITRHPLSVYQNIVYDVWASVSGVRQKATLDYTAQSTANQRPFDPNLRMTGKTSIGSVSQEATDYVGPYQAGVGPDNFQDIRVHLTNLPKQPDFPKHFRYITITDSSGSVNLWGGGRNPTGSNQAELVFNTQTSDVDVYLSPLTGTSPGQTVRVSIGYVLASNAGEGKKEDTFNLTLPLGSFELNKPMAALDEPGLLSASAQNIAQSTPTQSQFGNSHVQILALPSGYSSNSITKAVLSNQTGSIWSSDPNRDTNTTQALALNPTTGFWDYLPDRNDAGSTLTLVLTFNDGKQAAARFVGLAADVNQTVYDPRLGVQPHTITPTVGDSSDVLGQRLSNALSTHRVIQLRAGTYRLTSPLKITQATTIAGESGVTLLFAPDASWSNELGAIQIKSSHVTLSTFAVRFEANSTSWTASSDGKGVIWAKDGQRKVDLSVTNLDLQGPAAASTIKTDGFYEPAIGSAWMPIAGTWSVSGGVASQTSAPGATSKSLRLATPSTAGTNIQIIAKVRVDSGVGQDDARVGVGLFHNTNGEGYNLVFHGNNQVQLLNELVAWNNPVPFTWTHGTWYWFKLHVEKNPNTGGDSVRGKVWADGQQEPSGWTITQDGWTRPVGQPALNGGSAGNATASFDDVIISTPNGDNENATKLIDFRDLNSGTISGNTLKGGTVACGRGPWTIQGNTFLGTAVGTTSTTAFKFSVSHDVAITGNTIRTAGPSGILRRFLTMGESDYGPNFNYLIADNIIKDGVGADAGGNAPEIVVTEGTYYPRFEGKLASISADRTVIQVRHMRTADGATRTGDRVSILTGTYVGQSVMIAQALSSTRFLLDAPLPPGDFIVEIGRGFTNQVYRGNTFDLRTVSANNNAIQLSGHHWGTQIIDNTFIGKRFSDGRYNGAILIRSGATQDITGGIIPTPWGWSHAPNFDFAVIGNRFRDAKVTIGLEHQPNANPNRGRTYYKGTFTDNEILWTTGDQPTTVFGTPADNHDPNKPAPEYTSANFDWLDAVELMIYASGNWGKSDTGDEATIRALVATVNDQALYHPAGAATIRLPATQPTAAPISGSSLGQDGHDYIGTGTGSTGPDGYQDIHLVLNGIPSSKTIASVQVDGLGGGTWTTNGLGGHDKVVTVRTPGATTADLYMQPYQTETGRTFFLTVTYTDGTTASSNALVVPGVHANAALPMPSGISLGQDGHDYIGTGTGSTGPDGYQDIHLVLNGIPSSKTIASVQVDGLGGGTWTTNGLGGHDKVVTVRTPGATTADLYMQPYQTETGRTFFLTVTYTDGTTASSSALVVPGVHANTALPMPSGISLGQDGHDYIGTGTGSTGPDGYQDIHLVLSGIPSSKTIASVQVDGLGGGTWTTNGLGGHDKVVTVRTPGATTADLYMQPYQTETGRTFFVTVTYTDGTTASSNALVVPGVHANAALPMPSNRSGHAAIQFTRGRVGQLIRPSVAFLHETTAGDARKRGLDPGVLDRHLSPFPVGDSLLKIRSHQKASLLITSPPETVPSARQVQPFTLSLTNRTEPSPSSALTPPEW